MPLKTLESLQGQAATIERAKEKGMLEFLKILSLFIVTALAEIVGGYHRATAEQGLIGELGRLQ